MTLTDTGPLVALIDDRDPYHAVCVAASKSLERAQLLSTWPCFTEAMHLLGRSGGFKFQIALWRLQRAGLLVLADPSEAMTARAAELMEQYQDAPMDLADASLLALAESRGLRRIFTLDQGFRVFKLADGSVLDIIP